MIVTLFKSKLFKFLVIIFNKIYKIFKDVNWQNVIGYCCIKYIITFFILTSYYVSNAQLLESAFKKVFIEIDGEEVFDVTEIAQEHQGYMWMDTNLGLIRYNGTLQRYQHQKIRLK